MKPQTVTEGMKAMNLTRYAGKTFERLHSKGSRNITASMTPDLFGVGRHGKLGIAGHMIGMLDLSPKNADAILERGHRMQPLAANWYQNETGYRTHSIEAWAKHDAMNLYASPDSMTWYPEYGRWLPGEIKTKSKAVFDDQWSDGPPLDVLIQHQLQLKLTGAPAGPVICVVINEHGGGFELHHEIVEANPSMQEAILGEATKMFDMIEKGQLPEPDLSQDQDREAFIKMARAELDDVIPLDEEVMKWVNLYERQGKILKRINSKREEAKARILSALDGHKGGTIDDLLITHKRVTVKEHVRSESASSRIYFKSASAVARKAS